VNRRSPKRTLNRNRRKTGKRIGRMASGLTPILIRNRYRRATAISNRYSTGAAAGLLGDWDSIALVSRVALNRFADRT
jgi:hypothetical protein